MPSALAPKQSERTECVEFEWIIDNETLESLHNDPQELIQRTECGDRVVFKLTGVHKFKQTLVVVHDLEFVNESPELTDNKDAKQAAIFTCPDSAPFLRIEYASRIMFSFVEGICTSSDRANSGRMDSL